jgi:hypothetical protein
MPFKTSADTSPAWGRAADTVSYGRVELGKNGSHPSFEFVGMTKTERDTTSGAAGWATGAAATGNTITSPAESHAATALLLELTHQFI